MNILICILIGYALGNLSPAYAFGLSKGYDIWVGYSIWWYTHPRIIETFFDQVELTGKTVHLFATSGGSGISDSMRELKAAYPGVDIVDGKRI